MSFKVDIDVRGVKALRKALEGVGPAAREAAMKGIVEWAFDIEATAKRGILRGPKTGNIVRKRSRILHQASAKGEFPATDTGRLASSIGIDRIGQSVRVGTNVKYGKFLEIGENRRPWLGRSVEATRREGIRKIIARVRAAL